MLSTDQLRQLRKTLEAAGKRREAAARALAPKHKGGEWEEFHAAVEAELVAERALAAAQDQSYAVPVSFRCCGIQGLRCLIFFRTTIGRSLSSSSGIPIRTGMGHT
jgi:hypothetical protein